MFPSVPKPLSQAKVALASAILLLDFGGWAFNACVPELARTGGKRLDATIARIRDIISNCESFVIAGHTNPDGDAIGSCLGLAMALGNLGKKAAVLLEDYGDKRDVIPGKEFLAPQPWDGLSPEVMFVLDCGSADRLKAAEPILKSAKTVICIDHHVTHKEFAAVTLLDASASSTCELAYRLLEPMGAIDKRVASALYAGMLTDTGGFRYESAKASTMVIVADLISRGIPSTEIYNELLMRHTIAETRMTGIAYTGMEFLEDSAIAAAVLTLEDFEKSGASAEDAGGIVGNLLGIRGVQASVLVYEAAQGKSKASFRSNGLDVGKLAVSLGGGGHKNAAGATIFCGAAEAYETAKSLICKEYREWANTQAKTSQA
jgi:phosphoesterase RecJ-like protein